MSSNGVSAQVRPDSNRQARRKLPARCNNKNVSAQGADRPSPKKGSVQACACIGCAPARPAPSRAPRGSARIPLQSLSISHLLLSGSPSSSALCREQPGQHYTLSKTGCSNVPGLSSVWVSSVGDSKTIVPDMYGSEIPVFHSNVSWRGVPSPAHSVMRRPEIFEPRSGQWLF